MPARDPWIARLRDDDFLAKVIPEINHAGTRVSGTRGEESGPGTAGVSGSHGKNLGHRVRGTWRWDTLCTNYNPSVNINFTKKTVSQRENPHDLDTCASGGMQHSGV